MTLRHLILTWLAVVFTAGCAPAAGPTGDRPRDAAVPPTRPLVIALRVEPPSLSSKAFETAGFSLTSTARFFDAGLALSDQRGVPLPYLAEELPQLDSLSWRVFPDGRMETRYRLRSGITWHDGAPLSPEDFVFAWRVFAAPEYGQASSAPQNLIEEVVALDQQTLLLRWRRPFPGAGGLGAPDLPPLPRHILQPVVEQGQPDSFLKHPYWTREYVGLGPYRLVRWEPGAFLEAEAFDGHVGGRPKIDRLRVMFISDQNTVMANLLAEEVHLALDNTLKFQQGAVLQREWAARDGGKVLSSPQDMRYSHVQFRPEVVSPRALLDVRTRRALLYALQREELNNGLLEGQGAVAHSSVPPLAEHFPAVDRAISKYPFDLRSADQLLGEVGFSKRPDGFYANPAGERLSFQVWATGSAENVAEITIMENLWRQAGLDASLYVLPTAQISDNEVRASFPAFQNNTSRSYDQLFRTLVSASIPRAESRWSGNNRGGWSDPAFDRLADAFTVTLDRAERTRQVVEISRLVTDHLPVLPLYFNTYTVAHVAALQGPELVAPESTLTWNVQEWQLR